MVKYQGMQQTADPGKWSHINRKDKMSDCVKIKHKWYCKCGERSTCANLHGRFTPYSKINQLTSFTQWIYSAKYSANLLANLLNEFTKWIYSAKYLANWLSEFTELNTQQICSSNYSSNLLNECTHQIYSLNYSTNLFSEFTPWNTQQMSSWNYSPNLLHEIPSKCTHQIYSGNVLCQIRFYSVNLLHEMLSAFTQQIIQWVYSDKYSVNVLGEFSLQNTQQIYLANTQEKTHQINSNLIKWRVNVAAKQVFRKDKNLYSLCNLLFVFN